MPGDVGDVWLLAVPDLVGVTTRVAFAVRPATDRFTATEVARVDALLRLRRQLDEMREQLRDMKRQMEEKNR